MVGPDASAGSVTEFQFCFRQVLFQFVPGFRIGSALFPSKKSVRCRVDCLIDFSGRFQLSSRESRFPFNRLKLSQLTLS
jgi:hypothetical protein